MSSDAFRKRMEQVKPAWHQCLALYSDQLKVHSITL